MHGAWFSGEAAARRIVESSGPDATVVVVGAGVAGLAGARALQAAGCRVTVLEAQRAPGGRTRADRSLGGPVHLGAAWIHGEVGNPVAEAAARLGIGTAPSQWGQLVTCLAGRGPLDAREEARLRGVKAGIDRQLDEAAARAERVGRDEALGPLVRRLVEREAATAADGWVVGGWLRGEYENLYAAPMDDLSLRYRAEPFHLPGDDQMLTGSLNDVVAGMAQGLDVRCDRRVTAVTTDATDAHGSGRVGVRWAVTIEGEPRPQRADAVLLTVPVGVLKSGRIRVEPPLPEAVTSALGRIGAGRVAKVFAAFDEAFWLPARGFWLIAERPAPVELWVDSSALAGQPTLCGFATGAHVDAVEALDETGLRDLVAAAIRAAGL
jgi:monoamine oxidase